MPSPEPRPELPSQAVPTAERDAVRRARHTWWALLALSAGSVAAAGLSGRDGAMRAGLTLAVAALTAAKGHLVAAHFLEVHRAGPRFAAVVRLFALLAPVGLGVCALREWWLG